MMTIFDDYIKQISSVKDELEHSGRTFLQNLLQSFAASHNIKIIHEPKRDKQGKGAPDFKFVLNDTEIGYLENKKIGENLDEILKSEQIAKYQTLTDNLIVTDYLKWIWIYKDQIAATATLCDPVDLRATKIHLSEKNCAAVADLITNFMSQKPGKIGKIDTLAVTLARPAVYIKTGIEEELALQIAEKAGQLYGVYQSFKSNLISDLKPDDFADSFTQTLVYSLFIAKLQVKEDYRLTTYNIEEHFPSSFSLIRDLLSFVGKINEPRYHGIAPFIERLLHIVNHIDSMAIAKHLNFKHKEEKDPYIYFYEDFLKEYDKQIKIDRGVYYTPPSVVTFIVRTLDDILKKEFGAEDGLGSIGIEVLDFACGTGTFLLELYRAVLGRIPDQRLGAGSKEAIISEHLLKKVYGFELMIAPYAIAHLKLSMFLKEQGFDLNKQPASKALGATPNRENYHHRIPVYLTNTLENIDWEFKKEKGNQGAFPFLSFIEEIAKEGKKAQTIKDSNKIFVIMGNPPYKGHSMNNSKYIQNLMRDYYFVDGVPLGEKNSKWLQDDYVKFIRFAEDKISKHPHGGVVGIITPHNFLDNPTFRGMRQHLMQTFDKMYFIDLHGNSRKKEKALDGGKDENVFDIMQGVAISILVRSPECEDKDKGIYRRDLYGKRKKKGEQLLDSDIEDCDKADMGWQKLVPTAPFYLFTQQDAVVREEYDKGWSLKKIFLEMNTGIVSKRDAMAFQFTKDAIQAVVKDVHDMTCEQIRSKYSTINWDSRDGKVEFCKANVMEFGLKDELFTKCNYRPFDSRWTYYNGKARGFLGWPVYDIMQHMLAGDNVGLMFVRRIKTGSNLTTFISSNITDDAYGGMSSTSIAPLYLYGTNSTLEAKNKKNKPSLSKELSGNLITDTKIPNFTPSFAKFISDTFNSPTLEQILGYIYAVLHSPAYRTKYLEFLKIDFPKIPFDVDIEQFSRLSAIGTELIDAHLMKKIPKADIGEPLFDKSLGDKNHTMEKVRYDDQNRRLYFNTSCYFDKISPEVFAFKIGGYQVLDKYLKSRKGRDISADLDHVANIVKVLAFTIQKMAEIDEIK